MNTVHSLSMVLFQGGDVTGSDHFSWLVVFVGVIAFCSFVQFLVLVGAVLGALKAYKSATAEIAILKQKTLPLIASTQDLVKDLSPKVSAITASVQGIVADARPKVQAMTTNVQDIVADVTPKVKTISGNAVEISDIAKTKVRDFEATLDKANATVRDANDKTRAQIDRVDGMVASALKATSDLGNTVHRGIRMPVVEVAGVVNGLKAGLDVLLNRSDSKTAKTASASRSSTPGSTPGPVAVPSPGFSVNDEFDPSSNVAPSPGAAEVVERFRREQMSKL